MNDIGFPAEQIQDYKSISVYDEDDPNSMINCAPEWVKRRLRSKGVMELLALSEEELEKKVHPPQTLKRLRIGFWSEYERIFSNFGRRPYRGTENRIGINRVCNGVCTPQYFMQEVAENDYYLAWVVRPPLDYVVALEEALSYGVDRLREILNMPMFDYKYKSDGSIVTDKYTDEPVMIPNVPVANIILKTVAMLDMRVKGAIPQKIHQVTQSQNFNMNVHRGNSKVTVDTQALDNKLLSIDDLDSKIEELSKETEGLLNGPKLTLPEARFVLRDSEKKLTKHKEGLPDGLEGNEA